MRFLISMTSTGNPESKAAGISAGAFGILVAFLEMDQVTNSMNSVAFIVGSGTSKMVCGGGTKAEGVCVGTGIRVLAGVNGMVIYIAAVGRGAALSTACCISRRPPTVSGVFGVGCEGPAIS